MNERIAPWIGLPELPVVVFPPDDEQDERIGLHYKTRSLINWAEGLRFAWVDDEIDGGRRPGMGTWRLSHPGPALLYRVEPHLGLTEADYAAISEWITKGL